MPPELLLDVHSVPNVGHRPNPHPAPFARPASKLAAHPSSFVASANETSIVAVSAREQRPPLWALAAPGLYLLACLAAVRAVIVDRGEAGLSGWIAAAGLVAAFTIPAIFDTRRARLVMTGEGLMIDGALVKVDEARIERRHRNTAVLHLGVRDGRTRSFILEAYKDAQQIVGMLPPVSTRASALALRGF